MISMNMIWEVIHDWTTAHIFLLLITKYLTEIMYGILNILQLVRLSVIREQLHNYKFPEV